MKKQYQIVCHINYWSSPVETAKEAELMFRLFLRDCPYWVGNQWPFEITELPDAANKPEWTGFDYQKKDVK